MPQFFKHVKSKKKKKKTISSLLIDVGLSASATVSTAFSDQIISPWSLFPQSVKGVMKERSYREDGGSETAS